MVTLWGVLGNVYSICTGRMVKTSAQDSPIVSYSMHTQVTPAVAFITRASHIATLLLACPALDCHQNPTIVLVTFAAHRLCIRATAIPQHILAIPVWDPNGHGLTWRGKGCLRNQAGRPARHDWALFLATSRFASIKLVEWGEAEQLCPRMPCRNGAFP